MPLYMNLLTTAGPAAVHEPAARPDKSAALSLLLLARVHLPYACALLRRRVAAVAPRACLRNGHRPGLRERRTTADGRRDDALLLRAASRVQGR